MTIIKPSDDLDNTLGMLEFDAKRWHQMASYERKLSDDIFKKSNGNIHENPELLGVEK